MHKFLVGLLVLLAAIELEFALAAAGVAGSVALGALIAFACIFTWRELIIYDLIVVIVFERTSLFDPTLLALFLVPLLAAAFHRRVRWEPWATVPLLAVIGSLIVVLMSGLPVSAIGIGAILKDVVITAMGGVLSYTTVASV